MNGIPGKTWIRPVSTNIGEEVVPWLAKKQKTMHGIERDIVSLVIFGILSFAQVK